MTIVKLEVKIDDYDFIHEVFAKENAKFEDYVSRVVNAKLYDMKSMRRDMDLFRDYLSKHPRSNRPLWLYSLRLRKSLGWSHSHLLDVEDNILGSRVNDDD